MKMLLVLGVLMGGSVFASAANPHYIVSLNSFCDTWDLTVTNGINAVNGGTVAGKVFVWGHHDPSATCIGTFETIGTKHAATANVPPNDLFGNGQAILDIQDGENGFVPTEFLIRVTNGCGAAAYIGGDMFGINDSIFIVEDTCTVGTAPHKRGLKPMVPLR